MKFLLLLLLSFSVLALKPHTADYALSASDFEIANEVRTLSEENGTYHYTANAKTTGLASLIKKYQIRSKSTFVINELGMYSQHYQNFEQDGDEIKKDFNVYPKDQQVDSLNRLLAITHELEKNPEKTEFHLLVHDGKTPEKQYYQQVPNDNDNLIKVVSVERNLTAYFSKNQYYLPVLVHRNKFTYRLNSIKFQP